LASGARAFAPSRISRSVSLISRFRIDPPRSATIRARALLFVCAMSTPVGQARVQ